jgi:hypothetical protein
VVNPGLHPVEAPILRAWSFDGLNGRCSEMYKCLRNALGVQKSAKKCKESRPSSWVSSEEPHAICRFKIRGSDLACIALAPSSHRLALGGRNSKREYPILFTMPDCLTSMLPYPRGLRRPKRRVSRRERRFLRGAKGDDAEGAIARPPPPWAWCRVVGSGASRHDGNQPGVESRVSRAWGLRPTRCCRVGD